MQVQTTADTVLSDGGLLKAGAIGTTVRFIDSGLSVPDVLVDFGHGVLLQFPADEVAPVSEDRRRHIILRYPDRRAHPFWSPFPTASRTKCERCGLYPDQHAPISESEARALAGDR